MNHIEKHNESKLSTFIHWSKDQAYSTCVLAHYVNGECSGRIEVATDEIIYQIKGLFDEGFYVRWTVSTNILFLKVWEYGDPEPHWIDVCKESPK